MGIFSLFGKKDDRRREPAEKDSSRPKRSSQGTSTKSSRRTTSPKRDAQAALATARKIDAIESEMSSEFINTAGKAAKQPPSPSKVAAKTAALPKPAPTPPVLVADKSEEKTQPTLADPLDMGTTTQFLLNGMSTIDDAPDPATQLTPVIEEAAIMFANGQYEVVEQLLHAAVAENLISDVMQQVWLMLLDLYQIMGKQEQFESTAIDYASKFETSPPAWISNTSAAASSVPAGATPSVPFSGKLDAGTSKQIERIQNLAENSRTLRLEFTRVSEVDAEGCALLLESFTKLHKSGHALVLVGAQELIEKIRGIIEVGRRDDTEPAWLLLLELLRLLNLEKEFEETSIDYCVTFEVSPPAFVPPRNKVTTAIEEVADAAAQKTPEEGFQMPTTVEGRIDNLIVAIAAYSDEHNPAIIDCSHLVRIDFNAASRLLTGLAPFCGNGKSIEFHRVNHLISALFTVIGLRDIVRIVPRKN